MMEQFVSILINNGVAVAVVVYFLWKDATLTKENSEILQQVKALLSCLVEEKTTKKGVDENVSN